MSLAALLPPEVVVAESFGDWPDAGLLPQEEAALGTVAPGRRREFTTGRACARLALARLGLAALPILPGADRQPCWPEGVVGSITHCPGYRAAAATLRTGKTTSVGIDAEPHGPLPEGVLDMAAGPEEKAWLRRHRDEGICWDRVLFSAKESVFKAWYPLTGRWLGFHDALVEFDEATGAFRARLMVPGPVVAGRRRSQFSGRVGIVDGLVLTAVAVPAAEGER